MLRKKGQMATTTTCIRNFSPLCSENISSERGAFSCPHITFESYAVCVCVQKCWEKLFHFSSCVAFWWNYLRNSGCRRILCGMRIREYTAATVVFTCFVIIFMLSRAEWHFYLFSFLVLSFPFFLVDCRIFFVSAREISQFSTQEFIGVAVVLKIFITSSVIVLICHLIPYKCWKQWNSQFDARTPNAE